MSRQCYVYTLASKRNGTLYIGVTNNLARRAWEHKRGLVEEFTQRYSVHRLVYSESFRGRSDWESQTHGVCTSQRRAVA